MQEVHEQLGHIAPDSIHQMIKDGTVIGVTLDEAYELMGTCDSCEYAKLMCKPIGKLHDPLRQSNLGDEVHTDLWGPSPVQTGGHSRYYASFTDDYTRFMKLYLQKAKSDTFDSYQAFEGWLATQFSMKVKWLRSDCGGEYLSAEFTKHLKLKGTECRVTVHDTPKHNGVAEQLNCMLIKRVHAMMHASSLPKNLWGETVMHVTWVKNRTSTRHLGKDTPYEMLYQRKPNLENVPVWGCRVKVHDMLGMKLDMRAHDGHWVGFDPESDGHRIYFPDRGIIGIERGVAFEQQERAVPVVPLMASVQGEQKAVSIKSSCIESPPCTENQQPPETTDNVPTSSNANTDHLGPNFETPDPQPPPQHSTRQCFESEYFKRLREGEGTVNGRRSKETPTAALSEVLHGGRTSANHFILDRAIEALGRSNLDIFVQINTNCSHLYSSLQMPPDVSHCPE